MMKTRYAFVVGEATKTTNPRSDTKNDAKPVCSTPRSILSKGDGRWLMNAGI